MDFRKIAKLILIEQTLFTLPFAYLGILFAGGAGWYTWVWVTVALTAARTAGMSFNRIIDADIDARNPRTKDRLVPKGEVSAGIVWSLGIISSIILILSAYMLNMLCFYLSFPAIILLFTYSYFKRFSSSSHFYLGFVEAAAPIGGYLAVTGEFHLLPFLLGAVIMTWIAGLDIVYALQDTEFDKTEGLFSIPVKFGKQKALLFSAGCYFVSLIILAIAGYRAGMRWPFGIAFVCIMFIFIYQQYVARTGDLKISIKKYFKANMFISPVLFIGTFIDVYF
jgi:4-hydroxybenzoate polyprenyltransferase